MGIILLMLKWIGILLGVILGLLLFLVVCVLFVPVRYKVSVLKEENFEYGFCFSWFWHFVTVKKRKKGIYLCVAGIPIKNLTKKSVSPQKTEGEEKLEEQTEQPSREENENKDSSVLETKDKTETNSTKKKKKNKKKKDFSFSKGFSIIDLVRDKNNKSAAKTLLGEVASLLKYIFPKKIKGRIELGMDDPSTTGLLFGGLSLFPAIYQKGLQITPNFEEKVFFVQCCIKGRIRTIYLLRMVWRIWQDREIKRLWKNIKAIK